MAPYRDSVTGLERELEVGMRFSRNFLYGKVFIPGEHKKGTVEHITKGTREEPTTIAVNRLMEKVGRKKESEKRYKIEVEGEERRGEERELKGGADGELEKKGELEIG